MATRFEALETVVQPSQSRCKQFTLRSLLASIAISAVILACIGHRLRTKQDNIEGRWILIRQEIAGLSTHDWAGEYFCGDGVGANVRIAIAPELGFVFESYGCVGYYARNFGTLHFENDIAYLTCDLTDNNDAHRVPPCYVLIRWGDRRYLVPSSNLNQFKDAINAGVEPRTMVHGEFLLRCGDSSKTMSAVRGKVAPL